MFSEAGGLKPKVRRRPMESDKQIRWKVALNIEQMWNWHVKSNICGLQAGFTRFSWSLSTCSTCISMGRPNLAKYKHVWWIIKVSSVELSPLDLSENTWTVFQNDSVKEMSFHSVWTTTNGEELQKSLMRRNRSNLADELQCWLHKDLGTI